MGWQKILEAIVTYIFAPALLAGLTVIGFYWKKYLDKKVKKRSLHWNAERDARIKEILIEMRVVLKADRAYLTMFHNGEHYLDGSDKLKKSRTHESVKDGVSYTSHNFQDILVSLMSEEMVFIKDLKPTLISVNDIPDSKFRRMCEVEDVRCIARCPVVRAKEVIGFLGCDFDQYTIDTAKPDVSIMTRFAWRIEQALLGFERK